MIELLYRRKVIREMLNQFSTKQWNQIIPLILEIGVIYLRNNFRTTELSVLDFKNILDDMKHKGSELSDYLKLREGGNEKKTNFIENCPNNQIKFDQVTGNAFSNKYQNPIPNSNTYSELPRQKVASVSNLNNVRGYLDEEKQKAYIESYYVQVPDSKNKNRKMSRNRTSRNFVARKPSGEWRKGDDNVFRENENLQNLKKIYSSSPESDNSTYDEYIGYKKGKQTTHIIPDNLNSNIYPTWWASDITYNIQNKIKEDNLAQSNFNNFASQTQNEEQFTPHLTLYNNNNIIDKPQYIEEPKNTRSRSLSKNRNNTNENFKSEKAEVYFSEKTVERQPRSRSKSGFRYNSKSTSNLNKSRSRSKIKYIPTKIIDKEQDDLILKDRIKLVESKIRPQVVYDKEMFTQMKYQQEKLSSTLPPEWKYEGSNSKSSNEDPNNKYANSNSKNRNLPGSPKKNPKTNYVISYDRNLKPETIHEKSKEKTHHAKSKTRSRVDSRRNSERPSHNNEINNIHPKNDREKEVFEINEMKQNLRNYEENFNSTQPKSKVTAPSYIKPQFSMKENSVKSGKSIKAEINETGEFQRRESKQGHPSIMINNNLNIEQPQTAKIFHEDVSFKKQTTEKNETCENENLLSSFAPSERTKNFFQREFSKEYGSYPSSSMKEESGAGINNLQHLNNFMSSNNSQNFSGYNSNLAFSGENMNSQQGNIDPSFR